MIMLQENTLLLMMRNKNYGTLISTYVERILIDKINEWADGTTKLQDYHKN